MKEKEFKLCALQEVHVRQMVKGEDKKGDVTPALHDNLRGDFDFLSSFFTGLDFLCSFT